MSIYLITDGEDNEFVLAAAKKAIPGASFELVELEPSVGESWAKGRNGTFIHSLDEADSVDVPILREQDIPEDCWV